MFEKKEFKYQRLFSDRRLGAERVLLFGEHLGDVHTVAVDGDGNIVAVMKGDDDGTLRTLKVDSNARMEAVMKGLFGTTFKTLATDSNGNLIAILKGASGHDIAVDTSGYLTAIMHGDHGAVAQDAANKLISIMQGSQGTAVAQDANNKLISVMQGAEGIDVAQQATGELKSVMQGLEGATLRTVAVDGDGNIVAVMKGEHSGSLETIALDSEKRMIARSIPGVESIVNKHHDATASDSYATINGDAVPAGKLWKITNVVAYNEDGYASYILFGIGGVGLSKKENELPPGVLMEWNGELWLDETEYIKTYYHGITSGDSCHVFYRGTQINKT